MKKYLSTLVAVMLAALSFTLTSCGDDDEKDEPSTNAELVGTWEETTSFLQQFGGKHYTQFKSNGTYIEVEIDDDGDVEFSRGKWEKNGNTITAKSTDPDALDITIVSTVTKLTETELRTNCMGIEQTFKRVSDSTIDKYL